MRNISFFLRDVYQDRCYRLAKGGHAKPAHVAQQYPRHKYTFRCMEGFHRREITSVQIHTRPLPQVRYQKGLYPRSSSGNPAF